MSDSDGCVEAGTSVSSILVTLIAGFVLLLSSGMFLSTYGQCCRSREEGGGTLVWNIILLVCSIAVVVLSGWILWQQKLCFTDGSSMCKFVQQVEREEVEKSEEIDKAYEWLKEIATFHTKVSPKLKGLSVTKVGEALKRLKEYKNEPGLDVSPELLDKALGVGTDYLDSVATALLAEVMQRTTDDKILARRKIRIANLKRDPLDSVSAFRKEVLDILERLPAPSSGVADRHHLLGRFRRDPEAALAKAHRAPLIGHQRGAQNKEKSPVEKGALRRKQGKKERANEKPKESPMNTPKVDKELNRLIAEELAKHKKLPPPKRRTLS